jgi:DNA-directed RNA polymerase subunit M/transcription elongation factor TFIIS
MFCNECNHHLKRLITESNREKEVWKCMRCGHKEELELWQDPSKIKRKRNKRPVRSEEPDKIEWNE